MVEFVCFPLSLALGSVNFGLCLCELHLTPSWHSETSEKNTTTARTQNTTLLAADDRFFRSLQMGLSFKLNLTCIMITKFTIFLRWVCSSISRPHPTTRYPHPHRKKVPRNEKMIRLTLIHPTTHPSIHSAPRRTVFVTHGQCRC